MLPSGLGKRVGILGLGISGFYTAKVLSEKGFQVFVSEKNRSEAALNYAAQLQVLKIDVEVGSHDLARLDQCDWMVVSPGISPFHEIIQRFSKQKKKIYGDIEVAFWFCRSQDVIAVTGSAGKTTASTLIHQLFTHQGRKAYLCGNIGTPWIQQVDQIQEKDTVVLELSSFQLYYTESFFPRVGVLLNISSNHLDWHREIEHYVISKLQIFARQTAQGLALLRREDKEKFFPLRLFPVPREYFAGSDSKPELQDLLEKIAGYYKFPLSSVKDVLSQFKGIEHRLEELPASQGIRFVNDSKSTTPLSVAYALGKYPDQSVLLIAGGKAKSKDFDTIISLVKEKVKKAFLIGESASLLEESWRSSGVPIKICKTFQESITEAYHHASKNDIVLLSPGCASFDMFQSYIDRGNQFKNCVNQIVKEQKSVSTSR